MKKNHRLLIYQLVVMGFVLILTNSCEIEDRCETNKTGNVKVINETGYDGRFDVTWGDVSENYRVSLMNQNWYTFRNVPANGHPESNNGQIKLWIRLNVDGNWTSWAYLIEDLSACEDKEWEWNHYNTNVTGY